MNGKMKAIVKTKEAKGAKFKEVSIPDYGSEQVLIKVESTSICGTDLHIYEWNKWAQKNISVPQIMGHEVAGKVLEVGDRVENIEEGDFISAETHIPCGYCYQCKTGKQHICNNMRILGVHKDGVFAEYAVIDKVDVWKNDPTIPAEYASLQEPMGNAIDTILAGDVAGKNVLITGAGPAGLISVSVARAFGATQVIVSEPNDYRRKIALEMGADKVVNPLEEDLTDIIYERTDGIGVDFVAEMSGNEHALNEALKLITAGGEMGLLGLPDDNVSLDLTNGVIFKGITLVGVTGRKMFNTWYTASRLLKEERIDLDPLITHIFPLEEFKKGMELMESGNCGKIILKP
ncbi:L-threonine 3-dehydrogenase [Halanaerobium sp. DL-01]|uniref:L-threonine 3-dehydrogenase n=1 Tax=Halanaerobium sp. DL-01 TaxID=1653064 RepID=UPI000DF3718D|nr:L-threonine 3-dehydrogenase [Halanaerobium sp. DL-01]RCW82525.1 L-threonine 3-dehydrogenase [Halanaerobium sp. DL-01]